MKDKKQKNAAKVTKVAASAGTTVKRPNPKVDFKDDGSCVISHTEYIADLVSTSSVPTSVAYPLQPQSATVFTWLSAIATRFEMYRFRKLKFHYKPSSATSFAGWVVIGFDFDCYDTDFTKSTMLTWKYAAKCALWQDMTLDVSGDSRISTFRYCDSSFNERGDKRLDNLGNFITLSESTHLNPGELFVEYTVELRQPAYKIPPALYLESRMTVPMSAPDVYFSSTNVVRGNAPVSFIEPNSLRFDSAGQYFLDVLTKATSGVSGPLTVTFGGPASAFQATLMFRLNSTSAAWARYALRIIEPGVLATVTGSSGVDILSSFVLSTADYLLKDALSL
jgi:hypothetical protein